MGQKYNIEIYCNTAPFLDGEGGEDMTKCQIQLGRILERLVQRLLHDENFLGNTPLSDTDGNNAGSAYFSSF